MTTLQLKHPVGELGTMHVEDYHDLIHLPAYTAVEEMRRAGIPVCVDRVKRTMADMAKEVQQLQAYVCNEAEREGFKIKYNDINSINPVPAKEFNRFLFSDHRPIAVERSDFHLPIGIYGTTGASGLPATDDDALLPYAAVGPLHKDDDHPLCYAILKARSLSKARGTHLAGFLKWLASDGAIHAKIWWDKDNTTRVSASDPPVHQIPERSDPAVAKLVKSCLVPRIQPWLGNPDDWDPRKHGWCAKVDVKGAEAVIRSGCIARCRVSGPYLRDGKDIHAKTASIFYKVPEGTYKKGTFQRDQVGKNGYFLLIFGGSWFALQLHLWNKARLWLPDDDVKDLHSRFFSAEGYPDLNTRYNVDTELMFSRGYIEDLFGRRWSLRAPAGVRWNGTGNFRIDARNDKERELIRRHLNHVRHCYANRPTQASQGTTTQWCIALCIHGEYVPLSVPPVWESRGVPFPEAKTWRLNGGPGPGGRELKAWIDNTVHDSIWADGGPGTLEPAMKVLHRRMLGVPAPFLHDADMPWRVEAEVGPDFGHLSEYNKIAGRFGLEPMPSY